MKSIILGISSTVVTVAAMAAPAGATFNLGNNTSSGYIGGNASMSTSGYSRIGIKDGKLIFEGETIICHKGNFILGGMYTHNQNVNQTTPTLPSADTTNCNAGQVINDPPANSTVTINGFCDDDAAKLKTNVTGANVTVIVNSTGPCDEDDDDVTPVVTVDPKTPDTTDDATPTVKQASATTPTNTTADPKGGEGVAELPKTGVNEVVTAVIATVLAVGTYAGVMAVRAFRARA